VPAVSVIRLILHIIIILVTEVTARRAASVHYREVSLTYAVYTAALGGRQ